MSMFPSPKHSETNKGNTTKVNAKARKILSGRKRKTTKHRDHYYKTQIKGDSRPKCYANVARRPILQRSSALALNN